MRAPMYDRDIEVDIFNKEQFFLSSKGLVWLGGD